MNFMKRALATGFASMLLLTVSAVSLPALASAAVPEPCDKSVSFLKLPTWYAYLEIGEERSKDGNTVIDHCAIINPRTPDGSLDWAKAIPLIGLAVLEIMLRIAGLVGFIFVIYGGFKYITSQGEPEKTKTSRQTITNGLIGIVISIVAAAAVSFLANTLTTK